MALLASALPWQPGFNGERLPFFFKRFFVLSKTTGRGDNCILAVASYIVINVPTTRLESLNYTRRTKATESQIRVIFRFSRNLNPHFEESDAAPGGGVGGGSVSIKIMTNVSGL